MPADEIPDDIAALLRDHAVDAPAAGAQARRPAKTMRRDGHGPGTAALAGFAAGVLGGIVGAFVVVTVFAAPPEAHAPAPVPAVLSPQTRAAVEPAPVAPVPRPRMVVEKTPAPAAPVILASSTRGARSTESATERAWLDAARAALTLDDLDNATSNLETARARFPDGRLSEEREALAIHVLIARGERSLAELGFNTFRARHPGSPFALAIEEAMQGMEASR